MDSPPSAIQKLNHTRCKAAVFVARLSADYRTITPDGILTHWISQLSYFEEDGRTPDFATICRAMLDAMQGQWAAWEHRDPTARQVLDAYRHEVREVEQWCEAGCRDEVVRISVVPLGTPDPVMELCKEVLAKTLGDTEEDDPRPIHKLCRAILLVTFGEKPAESLEPIFAEVDSLYRTAKKSPSPRPRSQNKREDLAALRGGIGPKSFFDLPVVVLSKKTLWRW